MDNGASAQAQPPPAYTEHNDSSAPNQFKTDISTPDGKTITLGINLNLTTTPIGPTVSHDSVCYGPGQSTQLQSTGGFVSQQHPAYQQPVSGAVVSNAPRRQTSLFRMMGVSQIILGAVCILFGSIYIGLVSTGRTGRRRHYHYDSGDIHHMSYRYSGYEIVEGLTLSSTPIWCGLWFVLTGAFGVVVTKCKPEKRRCYKITFMVTSILAAVVFGPTVFFVSIATGNIDHDNFTESKRWLLPWFLVVITFIEIVIAICSASFCCCCARLCQKESSESVVADGRGGTYIVA